MDTLDLPFDLIWEGKCEPFSPSQLPLANAEDVLIFDNNFADDILLYDDLLQSAEPLDEKKSPTDLLLELENHILEEEIGDDISNQWLDESTNLPILIDYPVYTQGQPIKVQHQQQQQQQHHHLQQQTTQLLLRDIDNVFNYVDLVQLTPPQTPPIESSSPSYHQFDIQQDEVKVLSLAPQPSQPIKQSLPQSTQTQLTPQNNYYVYDAATTPNQSPVNQPDYSMEMEVVDELVRSRAENLPDWTDDDDSASTLSSSSSISGFSPRSDDTSYAGSSNDDDWSPKRASSSGQSKRRSKPYGRSPEDKKSRKKEQNKNAATRYRQKKKQEIVVVLEEERGLQQKNDKLQTKYDDVKREINYLKSLMRDLYRAKGYLI